MKKLAAILIVCFSWHPVHGQELNCQVTINTEQIQGSVNKQIFDQLKKTVIEFMNGTKWTSEIYAQHEKIESSILIIVKSQTGQDEYSGSIQVSSRRPVYKSGYNTQILNIEDEDFVFKFQQFSQLEFNLNTFQNNLTSVLQFYAYVIVATDNDSFAPLGGTTYWQRAQTVAQNAQSAAEPGWRSSQTGQKNRFWLVDNALQPVYKGIRDCMYEYCRNGLDKMYDNVEESRANIMKALELLKPVYQARPASYPMQVFFNAKRDEIINIFKGATAEEKNKVMETLMLVDPSGTTRYQKIQG
jgi:hypothetical protein